MIKYDPQLMSDFISDKFNEKKIVEYAYYSTPDLKIVYKIENDGLIKSTNLVELINWMYAKLKK